VASTNHNVRYVFSSPRNLPFLTYLFLLIPYGPQFEDGISPEHLIHQLLEESSRRDGVRNFHCAHALKPRAILLSTPPNCHEIQTLTTIFRNSLGRKLDNKKKLAAFNHFIDRRLPNGLVRIRTRPLDAPARRSLSALPAKCADRSTMHLSARHDQPPPIKFIAARFLPPDSSDSSYTSAAVSAHPTALIQ